MTPFEATRDAIAQAQKVARGYLADHREEMDVERRVDLGAQSAFLGDVLYAANTGDWDKVRAWLGIARRHALKLRIKAVSRAIRRAHILAVGLKA